MSRYKTYLAPLFVLLLSIVAFAAEPQAATATQSPSATNFDQVVDRVIEREAAFVKTMSDYSPLVETYIQNMRPDAELGSVPDTDKYFLGRLSFKKGLHDQTYLDEKSHWYQRLIKPVTSMTHMEYMPLGFAQMVLVDSAGFDRTHYDFKFVRREFLGEVRTIVMDVTPKAKSGNGRFFGRVWVDDQDFNIVRFNGTYAPRPRGAMYLHFDSWRLNMGPGIWLPAYIYSEESDLKVNMTQRVTYKAQTRLWGYSKKIADPQEEFTQVLVDSSDSVKDQSDSVQDLSPVASQRAWERQAEDNVLERLQKAGLLAYPGEVDKVLQTVINNIEITNNIQVEPDIRARVLLTSPIETFSVGHTIVISRGLLDVLPDEATLASVLAHELAHIVLGHRFDTKYAFGDRMLFPDEHTFDRFRFGHSAKDEQDADAKAVALLQNSPYKDKLVNAGLFLRQLDNRGKQLPYLVRARLGNPMLERQNGLRLHDLMMNAPALEPKKIDQIAALPLGGRIKLDPWSDQIEISKNKPVALMSAREKMPLEVTPMFPYLTRQAARTNTNMAAAVEKQQQ